MKTQVFRMAVVAVVVVAVVAVSAAMAQRQPGDVFVNVPFSFFVGNQQMPPGHYLVIPAGSGFLRMFDTKDFHDKLLVAVHGVESRIPQTPKLVFHRYGDSYFLAEVWNANGNIGRQLPKSKGEQEIASGKVQGTPPQSEIAVVRPER
jgi:hypothetical protein